MRTAITTVVFALNVAACFSNGSGTPTHNNENSKSISVTIFPAEVSVKPGQTQTFTATVTGAMDTSVSWSVDELDAGTITKDGVYTASAFSGNFHVVARANADTTKHATALVHTVPFAPTNLAAAARSPTSIDLAWDDNASDEDGYQIERKTGTGTFKVIASLPADASAYSNTGLKTATYFVYRVSAYSAAGNSSYSNEASALSQTQTITYAVAGGYGHSCALTAGGGAKCWGLNSSGQLGDGTRTDKSTPVVVNGLTSGVTAIAASLGHTCAVTNGGAAKCWGSNGSGQLGDGTTGDKNSPVDVSGLTSGVTAIKTGFLHTCAISSGGGVKCWGFNYYGELGDGTTLNKHTPVDVSGLTSGVSAIAVGSFHSCALTTGGGVKCWGYNNSGQLGSVGTGSLIPVNVTGLSAGVVSIAAGLQHTCALTGGGVVKCWGLNYSGQLGDGYTMNSAIPVTVSGLASGVVAIGAGDYHTCAVTSGVMCWGNNDHGQLGDGTSERKNYPVNVTGISSGVVTVAAGEMHSCVVLRGGGIKCWGLNASGQLGDGSGGDKNLPVEVSGLTAGVTSVSVGSVHTCAVTTGGGAKCWGRNGWGNLGDGTSIDRETPGDVIGLTSGVTVIAAENDYSCALTTASGAKCWGKNGSGQLGDGTKIYKFNPVDVGGLTSEVSAISGGDQYACALTSGGGVKCWGSNSYGQLGNGTTADTTTPLDVSGLASGVTAISAGGSHVCVITSGNGIKCWGANGFGQLGDGTLANKDTAVVVNGLGSGVVAIAVGRGHTCALTTGGGVKCWGENNWGQLGDGTYDNKTTPVDVSGLVSGVVAIAAGGDHTCAITTDGGLRCWGVNNYGQLGAGADYSENTPVNVNGLASGVSTVAVGPSHTCALSIGGGLKCWGYNFYGQLGDGTAWRATPVAVVGFP